MVAARRRIGLSGHRFICSGSGVSGVDGLAATSPLLFQSKTTPAGHVAKETEDKIQIKISDSKVRIKGSLKGRICS